MQIIEAIEILDGRNPPGKGTTVIQNVCPRKSHDKPTDGEYAAYLAGEYAMLARLVQSGVLQVSYVSSLISKPPSLVISLVRTWERYNIAGQRDRAARMIAREMEGGIRNDNRTDI